MAFGNDFGKIFIALRIFSQKDHVVADIIDIGAFEKSAFLGYVNFAANNGFYALLLAFIVKFYCAIHDAMVGNGQRIHAQRLGIFDHVWDLGEAI